MSAAPNISPMQVAERLLTVAGEIAVMPQVVYKIVETLRSETTSAADLEREISVDPGFSAKVLQQANSAYYALPRPVRSVKEAVTLLGFKQVLDCLQVVRRISGVEQFEQPAPLFGCWWCC